MGTGAVCFNQELKGLEFLSLMLGRRAPLRMSLWATRTSRTLESPPHGAGHKCSRSAPRRVSSLEQLREAKPWAYCRDVNTVADENPGGMPTVRIMEGAARLVNVLHKLGRIITVSVN
jgi:hypothetical protein